MQLGQLLNELHVFSRWIDENVSQEYKDQPLALKWLRCAKAPEEAGEVIDALIGWTGGNPRKPREDNPEHLLRECADTALTGILSLLHLLDDPAEVGRVLVERVRLYNARMVTSGAKHHPAFIAQELWMWDEQRQYDAWLEDMFTNVPDCWDGDEAAESILTDYLHHLEETGHQHKPWCREREQGL